MARTNFESEIEYEKREPSKEWNFDKVGTQNNINYSKPKLKSGGIDCSVYYGSSVGSYLDIDPIANAQGIELINGVDKLNLTNANGVLMPSNPQRGTGADYRGTSAKYENYGYETATGKDAQGDSIFYIIKFIIDPVNHTLSWGQAYHRYVISGGVNPLSPSGMCAVDENTLLISEHDVSEVSLHPGGTWTYNVLFTFPSGLKCDGDIIYRPFDNTIVVTMINLNFSPATREVHHYTYNGTLIDSHSMGAWGAYVTLFCHGGKIYSPYSPRLYEIETNPLNMTLLTNSYGSPNYPAMTGGDGGSSPDCCGPVVPIYPGCTDPNALNYDPTATHDCSGNPAGPSGFVDTLCCTYPCHQPI